MRRGFFLEPPLTQLAQEFGLFGPLNTASDPWLTCELDQHAAAVRDSIAVDGAELSHRSLTRYLRGFLDGCLERGWHSGGDDYDWETLRLLAICRMARDLGLVR